MAQKCYEVKNRSERRTWTAKRAGQACCYALRAGFTRAQIEAEIAKCPGGERRPAQDEAAQAMEAAISALEANNGFLDVDADLLRRFLTLTNFAAAFSRLVLRIPAPAIKVLAAGALGVRQLASDRLKAIAQQKAANDATISVLRQAAANAERFRRTGTGG